MVTERDKLWCKCDYAQYGVEEYKNCMPSTREKARALPVAMKQMVKDSNGSAKS